MMEDAGEDVLRQKPNVVISFFRRLGQVALQFIYSNSTYMIDQILKKKFP